MKCWNCETEFEEGRICPACGMEYSEKGATIEDNEKIAIIANDEKISIGENDKDIKTVKEYKKKDEKFPWYLSIWFIILFGIASICLPCIPGVTLGIIRFCKYKKKRASSIVIILFVILAYMMQFM